MAITGDRGVSSSHMRIVERLYLSSNCNKEVFICSENILSSQSILFMTKNIAYHIRLVSEFDSITCDIILMFMN